MAQYSAWERSSTVSSGPYGGGGYWSSPSSPPSQMQCEKPCSPNMYQTNGGTYGNPNGFAHSNSNMLTHGSSFAHGNPSGLGHGNSNPLALGSGNGFNPFLDLAPSSFPSGMDPKVIEGFRMADRDGSGFIDEKELKVVLASSNLNFSTRTVRLIMSTFTNNKRRVMGPKEFSAVYYGLQEWRGTFQRFDRNRNGKIDSSELRQALQGLIDYQISQNILDGLIFMFDKSGGGFGGCNVGIGFENFIECCLTVKGLTEKFKERDVSGSGCATFSYEAFMMAVLPIICA